MTGAVFPDEIEPPGQGRASRSRPGLCGIPWLLDWGYIDGCPVECRLRAGHEGPHAVELTWDANGWADVEPTRRRLPDYCGAPYPWAAGVSCILPNHPPTEPHRMSKAINLDEGLPCPEWPGNL